MSEVTIRVIHVNDVYELEEFPRLATLFQKSKAGSDLCLLTLGGDFLAPSLLSGLDHGKGIVDTMNATGVTHVCFGNHEADVPLLALYDRINQYHGKWINTNMPTFKRKNPGAPADTTAPEDFSSLPEYAIETATSKDGSHVRRLGLLGLVCGYPTLYLPAAFGGCIPAVVPVNESAIHFHGELMQKEKVDLVVPMTHQDTADDVKLLKIESFPLILAGHDHKETYEDHVGKDGRHYHMLKTGVDAHKAAVVDVVWRAAGAGTQPEISYKVVEVKDYAHDQAVAEVVRRNMLKLEALEMAVIYRAPQDGEPLTSKGMRQHQTTIGRLFCSALRDELQADLAMVDAGAIRGNQDYPRNRLSLSDIRKEIPFPSEMVVVDLDGDTIARAVEFSRRQENQADVAGYYQVDDGVAVDPQSHRVTEIGGKPLRADKKYRTVMLRVSLDGMNNNEVIVGWADQPGHRAQLPALEGCLPAKPLLLEHFAALLWRRLPHFDEIDANHDGMLSKDEVKAAYLSVFSADVDEDQTISDSEREAVGHVVDTLVDSLNSNQDDKIDREEYETLFGSSHFTEEDLTPSKARVRKRDQLLFFFYVFIFVFFISFMARFSQ